MMRGRGNEGAVKADWAEGTLRFPGVRSFHLLVVVKRVFSLLCLTHDLNSDNRQMRPAMSDHITAAGSLFGLVAHN